MARKIAYSTLNATTLDILNVIRQNASYDYQQSVPEVHQATDIPKVGEVIYGTPAFANQFINALINRIAIVRVQSATFNNPYAVLKKGYLEYGETVEDIFVNIVKAVDFTPEKGEEREFKRNLPDVRSAFHVMNWRVMYPVTIQDEDLKQAFLNLNGVTDLIAKIVDAVYTSAEYDEFLLFKYLLIKGVNHGATTYEMLTDERDLNECAVAFRGASNKLTFMSSKYNLANVKTTTPKDRQIIFMDSNFNAQFDVGVLARAFNMEKADFMGKLFLIDDWNTFDNERFDVIRENSDGLEEVTQIELATMQNVKAIIMDENWFQVYDNNNKFTEKYIASGLYWNYFYHTWKTISFSPFANAITFVTSDSDVTAPASLDFKITTKDISDVATVLTFEPDSSTMTIRGGGNTKAESVSPKFNPSNYEFIQTEPLTLEGIAVQKYGALIIPASAGLGEMDFLSVKIKYMGYTYTGTVSIAMETGDTVSFVQGA